MLQSRSKYAHGKTHSDTKNSYKIAMYNILTRSLALLQIDFSNEVISLLKYSVPHKNFRSLLYMKKNKTVSHIRYFKLLGKFASVHIRVKY